MPCMGPNLEAANAKGRGIGELLLKKLIEEYRLLEIDEPNLRHFACGPKGLERWHAAKSKFVEAVGDLFEENASNGF